jgi:DNA-binding NarL/FixJ family response regulator
VNVPDAALLEQPVTRSEWQTEEARTPSQGDVRVAIIASSPALAAGLTSLLATDPGIQVMSNGELEPDRAPDVAMIDPLAEGLLEEYVDEHWPGVAVLFIGEPPSTDLFAEADRVAGAVAANVDAVRLCAAVRAIAAGLTVVDPALDVSVHLPGNWRSGHLGADERVTLTPRERQVLELVARGYPNKSIAYELRISEHTAKFHVGSLLSKLEAASRAEVVTNATRRGLLTV